MDNEIKAIETLYNGYRFRSRLEARWAVFFDMGNIKYEYEPEGYKLPDGTLYLPDFYLPELDLYAEVKGERDGAWEEIDKASKAVFWGSKIKRIVILGNIPLYAETMGEPCFPCFYDFDADTEIGWWTFYSYENEDGEHGVEGCLLSAKYNFPWVCRKYGRQSGSRKRKLSFQAVPRRILDEEIHGPGYYPECAYEMDYKENYPLIIAYREARQARFEHGETPKRR